MNTRARFEALFDEEEARAGAGSVGRETGDSKEKLWTQHVEIHPVHSPLVVHWIKDK